MKATERNGLRRSHPRRCSSPRLPGSSSAVNKALCEQNLAPPKVSSKTWSVPIQRSGSGTEDHEVRASAPISVRKKIASFGGARDGHSQPTFQETRSKMLRLPDVGGQQGAFGPDYHSVAAEAGELPTL